MEELANVKVESWYRQSTKEWCCDVSYDAGSTNGTARYTGITQAEARNAAYAAIGYLLLSTTFK